MKAIGKIIIVELVFFLLGMHLNEILVSKEGHRYQYSEIPVLDIKFHLMGMNDIDLLLNQKIQENLSLLNNEFENVLRFELAGIDQCQNGSFLPFLHDDYFQSKEKIVDSLVHPVESNSVINVYVFESNVSADYANELMGFTPVFKNSFENYQTSAPNYDRIFISYSALDKQTTLIHEMGHFLGLDHPWEMDEDDKIQMGMDTDEAVEVNHMAYGEKVAAFTKEQLESMLNFTKQYRNYLVSATIYEYQSQRLAIVD